MASVTYVTNAIAKKMPGRYAVDASSSANESA